MDRLIKEIPASFIKDYAPLVDGFAAARYDYFVRFGEWKSMLSEPAPLSIYPFATVCWRAMRSISYAGLQDVKNAELEQSKFLQLASTIDGTLQVSNNTVGDLLQVLTPFIDGEILLGGGKYAESTYYYTRYYYIIR